MSKIVAIVGRANTGKSTLFNRLMGGRIAVTSDIAGTTRDRLYGECSWQGKAFTLVDTGGITGLEDEFRDDIREQVKMAITQTDLILFLVDGKVGITKDDLLAADIARRSGKKVILAVNKIDSAKSKIEQPELKKLGFGEGIGISALHGTGTGDLLDEVSKTLKLKISKVLRAQNSELRTGPIKIAIIGRPNVGKSSILNNLTGEKRAVVSDISGTTRDITNTDLTYNNQKFTLIDTAGIRRRGKIDRGLEQYSVLRALRAIPESDITFLVIDAVEGITKQDMHVAQYALENFKGLVIVVNKWDLSSEVTQESYVRKLRSRMSFVPWAVVIFTSAVTGRNINDLLETAIEVQKERSKKVPIKELNELISTAILKHKPATAKVKNIRYRSVFAKIYYTTQSQANPPTFVFMVNHKKLFHFSYVRYLENTIREKYGFLGTAIKIILKSKKEAPNYDTKKEK